MELTENSGSNAIIWYRNIGGNVYDHPKYFGVSIRCINNNTFTAIDDKPRLGNPEYFTLFQNYPNPFNPTTTINFRLPERARVVLSIYNELGEKVAVLIDGLTEAGYHSVKWNPADIKSGIYFYELKTDNNRAVKKLLVIK
jgi:hypothetical protein